MGTFLGKRFFRFINTLKDLLTQLFISENANVQRDTPTNKIDDVFFLKIHWNC